MALAAFKCEYCDRSACTADAGGHRVCLDHVNGPAAAILSGAEQQLADALKQPGRYGQQGNATTKDFLNRLRVRARNARDADQLRGVVLGLIDLLEDTL